MDFSFSQISACFRSVHDVQDAHQKTFEARLKHFQRLGFPSGVNTGKGKAAVYGWRELLLIALALQLTELGLNPEKIVNRVTPYSDLVVACFVQAMLGQNKENGELERWFFIVAMAELDQFREVGADVVPLDFVQEDGIVETLKSHELACPVAFIDATLLLSETIACVSVIKETDIDEVVESLVGWGKKYASISEIQSRLNL